MPIYFAKFPKILSKSKIILTDLVTRINILEKYIDNDNLYYTYEYQEGDTPEILASKYYGSPEYHWIILIANGIIDFNYDLSLQYNTFNRYIEDKYKDVKAIGNIIIDSPGVDYLDGYYEDIPLTIINPDDLTTQGTGARINFTISSGQVRSAISVYRGGSNYDANTRFSIANSYTGGVGSGAVLSFTDYMSGLQYAQTAIHPQFGYQKEVRIISVNHVAYTLIGDVLTITSEPDEILSSDYYYVDEESYYNLYKGTDPHPGVLVNLGGEMVLYDSIRVEPITVYTHEDFNNEKKRIIRILKKEYFTQVINEFNKAMALNYG